MPYPISEQLLRRNRSYQPLSPIGYVIHSTANKNDSAQKERDYFNTNNLNASVHYFVGATTIIRCVPENEVAWGCGSTGNHKFLQLEMCEGEDFTQVWLRTVSLVAEACVLRRWATGPNVYSHRGISAMYKETDHQDPIAYLQSNGKTWEQLLSAIDTEIANIKKGPVIDPPVTSTPILDPDVNLVVWVAKSKVAEAIKSINSLGFYAEQFPLKLRRD